jgi:predicted DNA-binding transcriptional regulator YafY
MYKKTDFSRLHRWLEILFCLLEQKKDLNYFCEKFRVSEKTIRRDIYGLSCCDIPVEINNNICRFYEEFCVSAILSNIEKAASSLSRETVFLKTIFHCLEQEHTKKLKDLLKPFLTGEINFSPRTSPCDPDIFLRLHLAVQEKRWQKIAYLKLHENNIVERTLAPLKIFFKKHAWYLFAFSTHRNNTNIFRINRIKSLKPMQNLFTKGEFPDGNTDNSFGAFNHAENELQKIKILFHENTVPFVSEIIWHPSQKWFIENGRHILKFKCGIDYDLIQWILGFGPECEVLEPCSLRQKIAKKLSETLLIYKLKPSG